MLLRFKRFENLKTHAVMHGLKGHKPLKNGNILSILGVKIIQKHTLDQCNAFPFKTRDESKCKSELRYYYIDY